MQRVAKEGLLAPNICIVCEERPDGDAVDTLRQGSFGGGSPYNGRKYVCWRCVEQFAKLFNFEKGDDVEQAKVDKEFAELKVQVILERVKEFAEGFIDFANHPGAADPKSEAVAETKVEASRISEPNKASAEDRKNSARPAKQKAPAVEEG